MASHALGSQNFSMAGYTWGRADQQTSHDSNRVWGVLFCTQMGRESGLREVISIDQTMRRQFMRPREPKLRPQLTLHDFSRFLNLYARDRLPWGQIFRQDPSGTAPESRCDPKGTPETEARLNIWVTNSSSNAASCACKAPHAHVCLLSLKVLACS